MKILLCEDEPEIAAFMTKVLEDAGIATFSANSGYEVLEKLQECPYDAVITDYRMANGDGGMVAHYCQERGIPCIVVTGFLPAAVQHYLPESVIVLGKIDFLEMIRNRPEDGAETFQGEGNALTKLLQTAV